MSGYTKLFASIIHSTIWQQPAHVRLVWITMLAMKDAHGVVEASVPGLAKASGYSIGETEQALAHLMAPDPYSRTPDHEGRRVEKIDGGWFVLNHHKYRDELSPEDQKAKAAERKRRWRDSKRDKAGQSRDKRDIGDMSTVSRHTEADPDPETHTHTEHAVQERALPFDVLPEPKPPSAEPRAIVSRTYQAAYEAARGMAWMQASAYQRELDAIGMWCEAQARRDGKATQTVVDAVLGAAFADPWMRANGFPLKAISKQVGELYKPPARVEAPVVKKVPNSFLLADLRQQIGEVKSSGRKDTAARVEALDARIAAEYACPTGTAAEPEKRGFGHR